jgi:uncharacterized protein YfaP (DUF2135 family)
MKKKSIYLLLTLFVGIFVGLDACKKTEVEPTLVGQPGDPRFNLVFTNPENVDMDLHVIDPKGEEVYYAHKKGSNGVELDIDCKCNSCPNGPNENIYWPQGGAAPKGTYKVWVEYYDRCGSGSPSSDFTIRVAINEKVKATYTGTLTETNYKSTVYTWTQP